MHKVVLALVAAVLIGCGGNDSQEAPPTAPPVVLPTPPPEVPEPPILPPDPPKPIDPPWRTVFNVPWEQATVSGGVFDREMGPECRTSPELTEFGIIGEPTTWKTIGFPKPFVVQNGTLIIDEIQIPGRGHALVSRDGFPHDQTFSLESTIDLKEDVGAWIGIAVLQSSRHYREISLRWDSGKLLVQRYTPCEVTTLATVQPGAKLLKLSYEPNVGWSYYVDRQLLVKEAAPEFFKHNIYIGLYVVNVLVESQQIHEGGLRATISPLKLSYEK